MLALFIVAGVILIVIFMLSIPIEMAFDFDVNEQVRSRMRVGWFFGLIWKDIGRRRKKLEDKRKPEKKKRKKGIKPLLSLFRTEGVPGRLSKLVRKILSCLRIRQLDANLRIGLDDPADTAILCSMVWPVLAFHNLSRSASVVMEPLPYSIAIILLLLHLVHLSIYLYYYLRFLVFFLKASITIIAEAIFI